MNKAPEPKQTRWDLYISRAGNLVTVGSAIPSAMPYIITGILAIWAFLTQSWLPVALFMGLLAVFVAPLLPLSVRQYHNLYLTWRGRPKVAIDPVTEKQLLASIDQTMQQIDERIEYQHRRIIELTSSNRTVREALDDIESTLDLSDENDVGQRALLDRLRRLEAVQNEYRWMNPTIYQLWERTKALAYVGYLERIAILKQTGLEIERALSRDRPPADLEQQVDAWLRGSEMASRIVRPYDDFMAGKLITSPSSGEIVEQLPRFNNVEFPAAISGAADASSHWHTISGSYAYKLRLFWIRWALLGQFHADLSTPFYREIDRSAG